MDKNKLRERKKRARKMTALLKKMYPHARIALKFSNNWELLVAVELSAQCTDKKVNEVTERLFKKYRTLQDYVRANTKEFEQDIRQTGFYRNKTRNILNAAKMVRGKYRGKVPSTMEEILHLPGIARKSANVILGNAYGVVEGIAVDTHIRRFAWRFDLTDSIDPTKIERDLMQILPKKEWFDLTYRLINYGRAVCPGRAHNCTAHPLTKIWPPAANRWLTRA